MDASSDGLRTPLDAFLAAFQDDIDADAIRPLSDYLARFPGDDDAIATEYRSFAQAGSKGTHGGADAGTSADRIAHYRIIRQLGRGGQGTVYLAADTHLHRQVALKIMDPGFASDAIAVERFKREAEITSKLDHPGICTVYETGEDRGSRWIAMRYIEGEPLVRKITAAKEGLASGFTSSFVVLTEPDTDDEASAASSPTPDTSGPKTWADISRLLLLFEDAARALHAAHEVGVIHRDIKPGNMMVAEDGKPVILDFGMAVDTDSNLPTLTMTGDLMGTKEYMSPEQIAAHRITLDRRTDVYSLGVSLFECLALRRPFEAPTREGLYEAIMTKAPPDLGRLNPALPADLRVVVATAIEKERDRRYQTALDLAEELRRVRMHEPIVAKPVGPMVRVARWSQRNPGLATAIGGLFVVLVAGLTVALFLLSQRDRALGERAKALDEKQAALSSYERLSDAKQLDRLILDAGHLWPALPEWAPSMAEWIRRAEALASRLDEHRKDLSALRASICEWAADQVEQYICQGGAITTETIPGISPTLIAWPADSRPTRIDWNKENPDEWHCMNPDGQLARRVSLEFGQPRIAPKLLMEVPEHPQRVILGIPLQNERLEWKHDTLAELVDALGSLIDPEPKKGLLAAMRARWAFAESVERETIGKYETKWADAIRSIADKTECPKYDGLKIRPQLGLIPIGRDPASGLWEFAHLQTIAPGTDPIPERDKDGKLVVTESMGIVFVLLPGGTFRMGAVKEPPDEDTPMNSPNVDPDANEEEGPVTDVALEPFFLSKYEMTQGQWLRLVGKNPSSHAPVAKSGGEYVDLRNPVEQVSWDDCDVWLGRLALLIPTEAQWEYAARAGTTTPRWTGFGTEDLVKAANLSDQSYKKKGGMPGWHYEAWNDGYSAHAPVGSFDANPFGLHDVLGNVAEWCRDWYVWYGKKPRIGDGLRPPTDTRDRVVRGGGWNFDASIARSAGRNGGTPVGRCDYLGIRPARRLDP